MASLDASLDVSTDASTDLYVADGRRPNRRALLSGALALGAAAVTPLAADGWAHAATGPEISGCAAWGARSPSSPVHLVTARPHKILVHHTATANSTDYSQAHAFSLARAIQKSHMDSRGFLDSGQHFLTSRGAHVMEGRHHSLSTLQGGARMVESAHCTGQNTVAIGIENEGTYSTVEPRGAQYDALVGLCERICRQYGLRAYQIYGHRDFANTTCPGDRLYALLPRLRQDLADRIGGDPAGPVWPVVRSGDFGERVRTLQYLLVSRGAELTVDGSFGAATESAVRDFQTAVKVPVDGVARRQTWGQLNRPLARGASGQAVKAVQSQLTARSVFVAVDGSFGAATESGVTSFQSAHGLPADGVVDARTWSRLLG
ncbi:N-acetylmuramoyl-L-alanine amidase [Streptomyces sp. V3I7]|uniref:peptidoglycan recognition protein family protein n=1 Tax=Streptomyces sp. V3I7 TaxID=3042278 RepID=UPI00277F1CEB|nr:N-acetylmuramoyl-L-alanine amidase [Streptomyces sp. V3I7]MDQ0991704.1 N-acetyl-anhydromuramyl-L-alanine amidase AmpD [Streptomyces sp. V3I7]